MAACSGRMSTVGQSAAGGNQKSVNGHKIKNSLTLCKKIEIIRAVEGGLHTRAYLAKEYGVAKSTVSDIIKKKEKIMEAFELSSFRPERKRLRTSSYADVEESLLCWLEQAKSMAIPITGPAVQVKGRELALLMGHPDFVCSKGWLYRFKARHGIMFRQLMCGGDSAPTPAVQSTGGQGGGGRGEESDWLSRKLPQLLVDYGPQSIFCADETTFLWMALPGQTEEEATDIFTVLVCTNMTGEEKLPLLVIGRCPNPKVFANVSTLPVLYEANDCAQMRKEIFSSWLLLIDRKFRQEGRKVAIVIDNAPCHPRIQSQLEAVRLVFLPFPDKAELHPCEQGVIKSLKVNYRRYLLIKLLTVLEAEEEFVLDLLGALHLLHLAWVNVSQEAIKKSFSCCGFDHEVATPITPSIDGRGAVLNMNDGDVLLQQLRRSTTSTLPESLSFEQYVDIDKDCDTALISPLALPMNNVNTGPPRLALAPDRSRFPQAQTTRTQSHMYPTGPPSARDADKAVLVLRRYFELHTGTESTLNLVTELEKRVLDRYIRNQQEQSITPT